MSLTLELIAPTGLTLTVELYPHGADAIANGAGGDALTEAANRKGLYTAAVAESLSGWHTAHVMLSSTAIAVGDVYLVDGDVCHVRDSDQGARRLAEAQKTIDTTGVPWQVVFKDRITGAELLRFDLKDEAGQNVISIQTFIGQQVTPPT